MSRFVRSWSAISRSLPQFAPARRPHARRRLTLECLEVALVAVHDLVDGQHAR